MKTIIKKINGQEIQGRRHDNGGGFVAATAYAESSVWVGPECMVLDKVRMTGNSEICGESTISGDLRVGDGVAVMSDSQTTWFITKPKT